MDSLNTHTTPKTTDHKLNGLFDIAEIAESLSAARDNNEPSLKKQRQEYSLALPVHTTHNSPLDIVEEKKVIASTLVQHDQGDILEAVSDISTSLTGRNSSTHTDQISSNEPKQQLQLPFRKRHLLPSSNTTSDSIADNPISPPLNEPERKRQLLPTSNILSDTIQDTPISPPLHVNESIPAINSEAAPVPTFAPAPVSVPAPTPAPIAHDAKTPTKLMDLYLPPRRTKKPSTLGVPISNNNNNNNGSSSRAATKSKATGAGNGRRRKSKTGSENSASDSSDLYCLCQQPYDPKVDAFMICCDVCDEWYHGSCVGITEKESKKIIKYVCPKCSPTMDNGIDALNKKKSLDPEAAKKIEIINKSASLGKLAQTSSDRKCAHLPCNNMAKPGSKYCSEPCSMSVAREAIKKKHEAETVESTNPSAADAADMDALEIIARKKAEIEAKLSALEKEQLELEKAIQSIAKRNAKDPLSPIVTANGNSVPSPSGSPSPVASPLSPSGESQESKEGVNAVDPKLRSHTNKRKKSRQPMDQMCGCPTSESPDGYCGLLRSQCLKHLNWEEMKRATLEHEKTQHKRALVTLAADETRVHNRMARRKESANNTHRTIVEA